MKYLSVILIFTFYTFAVYAQTKSTVPASKTITAQKEPAFDTVPPYKRDPNIPAFSIVQPDSSVFTKNQLPLSKYAYTVIIYFSPDCGHCQYTTKELVSHMDSLKNVFFVFVAYKPLDMIRDFYVHYHLGDFTNIRMGNDPKYYVPSFFRVQATPFVAVYDNRKGGGTLIKVFDPPNHPVMEVSELVELVYGK